MLLQFQDFGTSLWQLSRKSTSIFGLPERGCHNLFCIAAVFSNIWPLRRDIEKRF
jgi:hypothetical protein